jgi:hypothetical protein
LGGFEVQDAVSAACRQRVTVEGFAHLSSALCGVSAHQSL